MSKSALPSSLLLVRLWPGTPARLLKRGKKAVLMDHHTQPRQVTEQPKKVLSDEAAWFLGWVSLFVVAGALFAFGMALLVGTEAPNATAGAVLLIVSLAIWIGLLIAAHRRRP